MRGICVSVLLLAGTGSSLWAQSFVTMPVGVSAVDYSTACDKVLVDDRGQGLTPSGIAFRIWDRATGTMTSLPAAPAGYGAVSSFGMSDDATVVVGRAQILSNGRNMPMRCVVASGVWQDLGLPAGAVNGGAWGTNGDGSMVGGEAGMSGGQQPLLWEASTGPVVFAHPYGGSGGLRQFSSDGSVVTGFILNPATFSVTVNFYWSAANGFTEIAPGAPENVTPIKLSRNGDWVVCRTWVLPSTYGTFLWSPGGGREDIPLPPGVESLTPTGVSDDGNVVVGAATAVGGQTSTPWVWRRGWGHFFLGEWMTATLPASSLNFWTLQGVVGVSADGAEVIGVGSYKPSPNWTGRSRGWALTLPAPCVADMGRSGGYVGGDGVINNNDFVAFIDLFFAQNPRADIGVQGGSAGSDSAWDNNDFVVFIDAFFAGC